MALGGFGGKFKGRNSGFRWINDIFLKTGELCDLFCTIGFVKKTSLNFWRIFVFLIDFGLGGFWGEIKGRNWGFRWINDIFLKTRELCDLFCTVSFAKKTSLNF